MASLTTLIVFAALCTGTVKAAAAANGEGQAANGCSRDEAAVAYINCVKTTPEPVPNIRDAKGRPVSLYSDMSGANFALYMTERCMQKKTAVMACFQKFFSTTEGQKCVDPEVLTIEAQNTGGFCGAEGLSPWADALMAGITKWNDKCLRSPHSASIYYCARNGNGVIRAPETSADLTAQMTCIINSMSVGKMEECGRPAMLAYLFAFLTANVPLGVTADAAAISTAISTLPP